MPTIRPLALGLGLAVAVVSAPPLHAQDAMPNPAVKARQSLMTLFAFNLGTLGAMAQGNMEYDATAAGAAANNLMALSHLDLAALWPEGTDADSIDGTRALPDLWANFPDVTTKIAALQTATTAMADAAGTDLAGLQGAMGPLGAACGACHQAYRASE